MTCISTACILSYCAMLLKILKDEMPMFDIYTTVHAKILIDFRDLYEDTW